MPTPVALAIIGNVQVTAKANVRQGAPNRSAPVVRKLAAGTTIPVVALVIGESVQGNAHWYRTDESSYVWAGACAAFVPGTPASAPTPAPATVDPSLAGFGLDPQFAIKLTALLEGCRQQGHQFRISQGLRTPQTQALYYCQWAQRTPASIDAKAKMLKDAGANWLSDLLKSLRNVARKPRWQTNALPGAGWHQWGEAADCYCYRNGQMVESGSDPCYKAYADLAQQLGLTAGLHFSTPDAGHVQLRPGNATDVYNWPHIDQVMQQRFGDKPGVEDN